MSIPLAACIERIDTETNRIVGSPIKVGSEPVAIRLRLQIPLSALRTRRI